ncbi:hypothetical protein IV102_13500 [bacterium]|nr:hypothetical protein [bacterium]
MQLPSATAKLFSNFTQKGTLGEGAQRSSANMMDRIQLSESPEMVDGLLKADNAPGVDADPRPGFIHVSQEKLNELVMGGLQSELDAMPAIQLSPKQIEEFKQDIQNMVAAGIFTQAEADALLAAKNGPPSPAPAEGPSVKGSVSRDGENVSLALESIGGEKPEIEYVQSSAQEVFFLSVVDNGDSFVAVGSHLDKSTGQAYRENLSGEWKLLS